MLSCAPDFSCVGAVFRNEVCASLEEYARLEARVRDETEDYTESADQIRHEIGGAQKARGKVTQQQQQHQQQRCSMCGDWLQRWDYYAFPCGHRFHCTCLVTEALRRVTPELRARLKELHVAIAEDASLNAPLAKAPRGSGC